MGIGNTYLVTVILNELYLVWNTLM